MSPDRDHYREQYEAFSAGRAAGDPAWLGSLRSEALASFESQGFPTTRQEDWRYTNISAVSKLPFEVAGPLHARVERSDVESLAFPVFACSLFVFVNGHFEPGLSTPPAFSRGVSLDSIASVRADAPDRLRGLLGTLTQTKRHPFAALNSAFVDDGALLEIDPGRDHVEPIHLVFVSTGEGDATVTHPRVLIRAGSGSRATVIQDHVSIGSSRRLTNAVCEIALADNASLELVVLQRECDATVHVSNLTTRIERDARFRSHTISFGGAITRNDLEATLAGEGSECALNGLFLGTGTRVIDNHTLVDHAVPHGTSRELYKGILGDASRGVFRGKIVVRPHAQKTDAQQSNPNLLVSDRAEVDTRPQLEIYADDVRCSHGSTIGQLDADALFYLRTRGIGRERAVEMLTQGFAQEITAALPDDALAERVRELLIERMQRDAPTGTEM